MPHIPLFLALVEAEALVQDDDVHDDVVLAVEEALEQDDDVHDDVVLAVVEALVQDDDVHYVLEQVAEALVPACD